MRLLPGTHAVLWWLDDDGRLGPAARALVANPGNDVLVSAVSLWEITLKVRIGKLTADAGAVLAAVDADFTLLPITGAHLLALGRLPLFPGHKDPFDHLLIAQAMAEGVAFVSADGHVADYPVPRIACSA